MTKASRDRRKATRHSNMVSKFNSALIKVVLGPKKILFDCLVELGYATPSSSEENIYANFEQ